MASGYKPSVHFQPGQAEKVYENMTQTISDASYTTAPARKTTGDVPINYMSNHQRKAPSH